MSGDARYSRKFSSSLLARLNEYQLRQLQQDFEYEARAKLGFSDFEIQQFVDPASFTTVFTARRSPEGRNQMFGLDFETYGRRDLKKVGLANYIADPEFAPLIAALVDDHDNEIVFDFVCDPSAMRTFAPAVAANTIAAHNAPFEEAVIDWMGNVHAKPVFLDSAVLARCVGAESKLEHAGPQLVDGVKLEDGRRLIKKFSLAPTKPTAEQVADDPDWELFKEYCLQDARLSLRLWKEWGRYVPTVEHGYAQLTGRMNQIGWHVDLDSVREMSRRYEENKEVALETFRMKFDPDAKLNLNSLPQLKAWCGERGVRATSFSEENVTKLLARVEKKLAEPGLPVDKQEKYGQVRELLVTKQILGGSSLTKLKVIQEMTGEDSRLRHQYLHVGAGQTLRTSGRGVQMQNLKRLRTPKNMSTLSDPSVEWTNEDLATNLRQVFTATDPQGSLIVGDFSSIESRGLGYLANESWKLKAYHDKKDLYKVQAATIYGVPYDAVTKSQRQTGKVGELSCGYGAGPGAVVSFAQGMGVEMSEEEAATLVRDWRDANPKIVDLWDQLDEGLHAVVTGGKTVHEFAVGPGGSRLYVSFAVIHTPASLARQHPASRSVQMLLTYGDQLILRRVFHGCYARGRNICYYRASAKNGKLWSQGYTDPKTKRYRYYDLYGGKLAGILTQSFCREIFFAVLQRTQRWVDGMAGVEIVGQFHDELVFDYSPNDAHATLDGVISGITNMMTSQITWLPGFPLAAEVKADYRYTK